jgi:hypothetical protein
MEWILSKKNTLDRIYQPSLISCGAAGRIIRIQFSRFSGRKPGNTIAFGETTKETRSTPFKKMQRSYH